MQILISNNTWIILLLVKISKKIGVFGRIKNNLTVDAANKIYHSLVLLVMDCCDVAWSSIGKIERDKLDWAQRRAAKIVLKTKDSDVEKNLKWLPLSMRHEMHTINLTFKCLKGSPQMSFKDYFKVFRTIHNTRGSGQNLLLPKVRTETERKSFYFKRVVQVYSRDAWLLADFYFPWNVNLINYSSWSMIWRFCVTCEELEHLLTNICDFTTLFGVILRCECSGRLIKTENIKMWQGNRLHLLFVIIHCVNSRALHACIMIMDQMSTLMVS